MPTRNTDLQHLRDGFIRGITARTKHLEGLGDGKAERFSDDAFGAAVTQFKAIWGGGARKNVPKGETLLLTRDTKGRMAAWIEDKKGTSVKLGGVEDERLSRLIWLGYLGGKTVSSESARQSVVDGVVEFVREAGWDCCYTSCVGQSRQKGEKSQKAPSRICTVLHVIDEPHREL